MTKSADNLLDKIIQKAQALKTQAADLWEETHMHRRLLNAVQLMNDMAGARKRLTDKKRTEQKQAAKEKREQADNAADTSLPQAWQIGEQVGDKGIFIGTGYVRHNFSIVGAFNFFAAPRDLHSPYTVEYPSINYKKTSELAVYGGYNDIMEQIAELETADGHKVKAYKGADDFYKDVAAGTYAGEFFVPNREIFKRLASIRDGLSKNEDYITANTSGKNVLAYSPRENKFHWIGRESYTEYEGDSVGGPPGGGYTTTYNTAYVRMVRAEPIKTR